MSPIPSEEGADLELSFLMPTYSPAPVRFVRGKGSWLYDDSGRRYLDFLSGIAVTSLGHCHPKVVAALRDQAGKLWHVSNLFHNELAPRLARELDSLIAGPLTPLGRVFFANSGAEANEAAFKLVRRHMGPERGGIIAMEGGFHGRTLGALAATGQASKREPFQPLPGGFTHVPYGDIEALRQALQPTVGAVMLEPILGEAGVIDPPDGYLAEVRRFCDEAGILLVVDEVQTGLGRTGTWFAYQHEGIFPDLVTVAKPLGSGFPIAACWARREVADSFRPGDHGTTFGGQPLACSAALATLEVLRDIDAPARARALGQKLRGMLGCLRGVQQTRGRGLLVGVVLNEDAPPAAEVARAALEAGLVLNAPAPGVLRLAPPLSATEEELEIGVGILGKVLERRSASPGMRASACTRCVKGASASSGAARHLLEVDDLSPEELFRVLDLADEGPTQMVLEGRGMALLFEHPSARTRNACEMAVFELGGHPLSMRGEEVGLDVRESAEDVARTLACYHAALGARVRQHRTLERFCAAIDKAGLAVPVVNLLSDQSHPTQALADLLVLRRRWGELAGRRVAWIGDASNVCRSFVLGASMVGLEVSVASPTGYGLDEDFLARASRLGGRVRLCARPQDAASGADALATDVWASMGQEDEAARRREAFVGWTVDEELVQMARPEALVLHCLPAHRGEEISAEVLESSHSVVWEQARARKDAMVGLLRFLLGG